MVLDGLAKKVLTSVYFYAVLGFILLSAASVTLYKQNAALKAELAITQDRAHQNELAWRDSTGKQAGKITILDAFIENLQTQVSKANKEIVFWRNSYKHVIDSVHAHGNAITVSGQDSIGKYVNVEFSGKQSIASYKCGVKVYLTPLSSPIVKELPFAVWTLNIGFDDIYTASEFDRNAQGVFFIRTTSQTPGVNVIGYSELDSTVYPYLYGVKSKTLEKLSYTLYGGGLADRQAVSLGVGLRTSEWLFLLNYRVFESTIVPNSSWYDHVQIGVYHGVF